MKLLEENNQVSKELFVFLRYNQIPSYGVELSQKDEGIYQQFVDKIQDLKTALEKNDSAKASSLIGSVASMFGFNRHYCSISGLPIIGKYKKIGNKIVSPEAYDSYMIVQELEKMDNPEDAPEQKKKQKKTESQGRTGNV